MAGAGDKKEQPAKDADRTLVADTADQTVVDPESGSDALPPLPEGNEDETVLANPAAAEGPGLHTAAELPTRAIDEDSTQVKTNPGASPLTGRSYVPHASNVIKDRFVLESRLGKGGMGQVYKARDLRKEEANDDNPWVAIKFLGEEFSRHPKALISLQREAKKSQQLAHPNVLTVYDFDRDGDRVYMTMEMLQGDDLSGLKKIKFAEGKEPDNETLIEQMASGLAYAHENGLVHSDFKPDNVFVTTEGRVKILDFGIARIMDSAVQKDSFDAGELGAMTLRYASLEMLRRDSDPHPSDDVYALGLIAYQLYAGVHPYGGRTALDALDQGLTPQPIKGIKRHQWRAIAGAIALERADRTASAEQFHKEFSGTSRRNRILLALVLVLALASGYFAWEASKPEGPAVPFAELPAQVQSEFRGHIDRGQQSAEIGDWDGASRYFTAAYALHPRNPEAEEGLRMLVQHLVEVAPSMVTPRQQEYLAKLIDAYAEENEYLANDKQLAQVRDTLRAQLNGD
ncbi:serine/threonine-protein kinase [Haliea sp. E1-2-M8]|uniref:serine/threonine-protein kinase n=1 Tax=Haliea sp. E1-2-M8 TaxID=3064706 RepID=UPI00272538A8|nr:serine/threonine-protein kinase [Haliea sp. E1-2-M8]MDO8860365.1 serine/threonine-protein kinase [Haliea sp. E1-2-M8]